MKAGLKTHYVTIIIKPTKIDSYRCRCKIRSYSRIHSKKIIKITKEFHDDFIRTLKDIAVNKGKITTTDEIAKLWQEFEYYEQANKGTTINFNEFKYKTEALLTRKPHEDVVNFLQKYQR